MNESAFLDVHGIQKKWDSVDINFSFSARKGTLTSIVGPSGSGKSTVLRIIAGLDTSDTSETKILLDGKDITSAHPGKRECGMVFQNASLFLNMNVEDNVAYGLCCSGMNKREARQEARKFLAIFNMENFALRMPETLSGGEAQRVALARTLIMHPKLVLLDEPLSALDAPLRKKLGAEIRDMQKKIGFTAVMVTHDIKEATSMSDTIILMKQGTKLWEGIPSAFPEELLA